MSNGKPPDPKADALAKQLKDTLAQRRPRPWKLVLASLVISTLLLILLAWWMYPRARSPLLQVLAFDVICTPEETPEVRGQLMASAADSEPSGWSGHRLIFRGPRLPGDEKQVEIDVKSDERGQASVEWRLRKPESSVFQVIHVDADRDRTSLPDDGRIFVWPKDAPILIVDAEETLIAGALDEKASQTLLQAKEDRWNIVYLVPGITSAHEFRKARRWINEKQAKLPIGPVLGRAHFSSAQSVDDVRRDLLKPLQDRFKDRLLAVVKSAGAAKVCKDAGVRTVMIGADPAPPDVLHAASWAEVKVNLK